VREAAVPAQTGPSFAALQPSGPESLGAIKQAVVVLNGLPQADSETS